MNLFKSLIRKNLLYSINILIITAIMASFYSIWKIKSISVTTKEADSVIFFMSFILIVYIIVFFLVMLLNQKNIQTEEYKNKLKKIMQEVLNGNLNVSIKENHNDMDRGFNELFHKIIHKWKEQVELIHETFLKISDSMNQLSGISKEFNSSFSTQSASMEEVFASIEEITATMNQNTSSIKQTNTIFRESFQRAEEGGTAVVNTLNAMKQIVDKISIIEEIASQTKLLAINASIEAARAGENGNGFQIVATEVRKLSGKSKKAVKEIQEMASSSLKIANHANNLIRENIESIKKIAELVQEMSVASGEQSIGVSQINTAIGQLNQVSQNHILSIEKLTTAFETVKVNLEKLRISNSFFRV